MRARVSVAALIVVIGLCVSIPTAAGAVGTPQTGSPVSLADLVGSLSGTTTYGNNNTEEGCNGDVNPYQAFDAAYPGSAAVGVINLHIQGCLNTLPPFPPFGYGGHFTITTTVGTLAGNAAGSQLADGEFELFLDVLSGTGAFAMTTATLLVSIQVTGPGGQTAPMTGSVTVTSINVVLPSNGANVSGDQVFDASASYGANGVAYELTGGNLNDTVIVAHATPTYYGWLASWDTTTVPNGTYTLQGVTSFPGSVFITRSPGITITVNNAPPSTSVVLPANNATLSGTTQYLDATASSGVTKVIYEVSGGPSDLSDVQVGTGTPTLFGWLAVWNTTTVPNGTYTLQSVASNAGGLSGTSTGISVTVKNLPTTNVLLPSKGATLSGSTYIDASASNATSVEFWILGGSYGLSGHLIGTATDTLYGWLDDWNTTTVPNGSYVTLSEAFNSFGSTFSSGVTVTVANPGLADLANSSFTVTASDVVGRNGCSFVYGAFDAVYPGSAAVGNVTLHMAGCATPYSFTGSFAITTGVGTLSGSATGPIITQEIGVDLVQIYQITLSVNAATGSFAGTTGSLLFTTSSQGNVASVAVE